MMMLIVTSHVRDSVCANVALRLGFVCLLFIATCSRSIAAEPGVLRVGADIDYRPYSFVGDDGRPAGFDIELARLVAARLGLTADLHVQPWDRVLQALKQERLDVAVGVLFTMPRSEEFIFTDPYNSDTISIVVRDGTSVDRIWDLDGKVAAVLEGDAIPETVLHTSGLDPHTRAYATLTEALLSVADGSTDYALVPYAVGMELLKRDDLEELRIVGPPVYTIQYRFAVHRSQLGFCDQLNREIQAIIETEQYAALRDEWLRYERRELSVATVARYIAPVGIPLILLVLGAWVWALKRQVRRQTRALARKNAELEAMATRDTLTGLPNRRHFDAVSQDEFERSRRAGRVFSILYLDLDHFKTINDRYGHASGDAALREVAQRVSRELRRTDIVARYGGEEFVALLCDSDRDAAIEVAERIWARCRTTAVDASGGDTPINLTISIGVATVVEEDGSVQSVLGRADAALYSAKNQGRDRIVVWDDCLPQPVG